MTIQSTIQIWREGNQYIAHAMPIDVASSGKTAQAARAAMDEAVRLFVSTASAAGTLEEVLEECGYEHAGDTWRSPTLFATEEFSLALVD